MTTPTAKLQLIGICHQFDGKALFSDLSLSIFCGKIVAIVGASGVGKTTLFNIASGLITPTSGKVLIDGKDGTGKAGGVGYMLQKDLLLPFKSVYDNIALPLTLQNLPKSAIHAKIMPLLPAFGLHKLYHKYPSQLSGGQRQRIAIARVMLKNAPILLLDEATSALDSEVEHAITQSLDEMMNKKTVIAIAHRLSTIASLDRLVVMDKGEIVEMGSHDELIAKGGIYANLWARQSGGFLGEM